MDAKLSYDDPVLTEPPAAPTPPARPSPLANPVVRGGLLIGALLVLLLALVAIFNWWTIGRFTQSTNDAFLQADQVAVAPRISGYVQQVLVADNQDVAAGQPLVVIDPRDSQAKLDQAQALADQGKAAIGQAQAQIDQQKAQVADAEAKLYGQKVDAAYATGDVARYTPLAASGAETVEHLDQLKHTRDQANAQALAGAAEVAAAKRQIATYQAQIGVSQAQIEQAQAQVNSAKVDVDASVVRASIAGRVGDRSVRPGQYVQPGTRMLSVVPLSQVYLIANFKETQLGRMRPGQPVEIKIDALGGRKIKGVVDSFSPGTGAQFALIPPSNATGNFTKIVQRVPVRIRIEAPDDVKPILLPGLSVTVAVDTRDLKPQ